jgi:hypothetical protein
MLIPILERKKNDTSDTVLTLASFSDGLIDAGHSRVPLKDSPLPNRPPYQGSVQTHLDLLQDGRAVLDAISTDERVQEAAVPTLFHPDLHERNIFVSDTDPTEITGIIDSQSCSIEPAFWYADELPDFVPDTSSSSPSTSEIKDSDLCAKAFDAYIQYHTPKLGRPRLMDERIVRPSDTATEHGRTVQLAFGMS